MTGGLIGRFVGAGIIEYFAVDKKIQVEGKSDSEIKKILEDLRKKVLVPDFQ